MKIISRTLSVSTLILLLLAAGMACTKFDKAGLNNAVNLNTALMDLMPKATEQYSAHSAEIEKVKTDFSKAVAHAAQKKGNKALAEAWKTLESELVMPFFQRWKDKGKLDEDVAKFAAKQVSKSLEAIKNAELSRK